MLFYECKKKPVFRLQVPPLLVLVLLQEAQEVQEGVLARARRGPPFIPRYTGVHTPFYLFVRSGKKIKFFLLKRSIFGCKNCNWNFPYSYPVKIIENLFISKKLIYLSYHLFSNSSKAFLSILIPFIKSEKKSKKLYSVNFIIAYHQKNQVFQSFSSYLQRGVLWNLFMGGREGLLFSRHGV